MARTKRIRNRGTNEWASKNENIFKGCKNNCRYCYARNFALRMRRIDHYWEWTTMHLREDRIGKSFRGRGYRIMFPSTHDLFPEHLDLILAHLEAMLFPGNNVLLTTKARIDVIRPICEHLSTLSEEGRINLTQLEIRVTIGSANEKLLKWWEPNAPSYAERSEALQYAYNAGLPTSVSIEPFLDLDPGQIIDDLEEYISEVIWIGKCNNLWIPEEMEPGVPLPEEDRVRYLALREMYSIENMQGIYNQLKTHPLIQWKNDWPTALGFTDAEETE